MTETNLELPENQQALITNLSLNSLREIAGYCKTAYPLCN